MRITRELARPTDPRCTAGEVEVTDRARVTNLISDYQQRTSPPLANALQLAINLADGLLN